MRKMVEVGVLYEYIPEANKEVMKIYGISTLSIKLQVLKRIKTTVEN